MLWTLPLLLAPGLGAPLHDDEAQEAAQAKPPTMAESVEVLSQLLVRGLNEPPAGAASNQLWPHMKSTEFGSELTMAYVYGVLGPGDLTTGSEARKRASNARGFHLPGAGATYTIDVRLPVKITATTSATKTDEPDDSQQEWDEILRALRSDEERADAAHARGDGDLMTWYGTIAGAEPPTAKLDPAAVDAAIAAVLDALAKHGRRLELNEGEGITVALTARGVDPVQATWQTMLTPSGDQTEDWLQYSYYLNLANGQPDPIVEHIVVRVSRSALEKGFDSGSDLRGHAQIHRY